MFEQLDDLIEKGVIHSVFVGRSVTASPRFATLRTGAGDTVSTGKGRTCADALQDALNKVGGPRVQYQEPAVQTMPLLPGVRVR